MCLLFYLFSIEFEKEGIGAVSLKTSAPERSQEMISLHFCSNAHFILPVTFVRYRVVVHQNN